jgi:hypothetical protein
MACLALSVSRRACYAGLAVLLLQCMTVCASWPAGLPLPPLPDP